MLDDDTCDGADFRPMILKRIAVFTLGLAALTLAARGALAVALSASI